MIFEEPEDPPEQSIEPRAMRETRRVEIATSDDSGQTQARARRLRRLKLCSRIFQCIIEPCVVYCARYINEVIVLYMRHEFECPRPKAKTEEYTTKR